VDRHLSLSGYLPTAADSFTHFRFVQGKTLPAFESLPCLVARAWADGRFEFLIPAWDALGYSRDELAGRCVCELVALDADAARAAVRSLLTEGGALEFALLRKDGRALRYRWNRQFDVFTTSLFIVGEELPDAPPLAARVRNDQREALSVS